MFDFVCEIAGYEIWTPVLVASYWLKVVSRPPRLPEDSAWLVPHRCFYSIERGGFLFRLEIPFCGQLIWGSCGTPHNEFMGKSQVLPIVEAVRDLRPERLQSCLYLV